ncbi:MAG: SPOR domain-containing protein [Bacteroidales bacterium]|nr:SPOR domain-containing protein [Bacteroidales bacterium]
MKIKLFFLLLITNAALITNVCSQDSLQYPNVKLIQDSRIDTLIKKHILLNEKHAYIPGWRIQIFFESGNNSKSKALQTMEDFNNFFPDIPAYLSFKEPYYKIRVGDYRTRLDAERSLRKIIRKYPNAIYVKENKINFPKLN